MHPMGNIWVKLDGVKQDFFQKLENENAIKYLNSAFFRNSMDQDKILESVSCILTKVHQ